MTIGSTLPNLGLVPPSLRRTPIPRELQPDLPDPAERLQNDPPEPEIEEQDTSGSSDGEGTGRPVFVINPAALSAQEEEGGEEQVSQQPPQELPTSSAASRRIEQALQETPEPADNPRGLTEEEEAQVRDLQARDREVRAHEQAHANVGGIYAGAPTYEFVTGPDGRRYAVAGQVRIDTAEIEGDPEATIEKLETVRRAALAPAEPSTQDRRVAQQAEAGIRQARAELSELRAEEREELLTGDEEGEEGVENLNESASDQLAQGQGASETGQNATGQDQEEAGNGFASALQGQAAFAQASQSTQASQTRSSFPAVGSSQNGLFGNGPREPVGIDLLA